MRSRTAAAADERDRRGIRRWVRLSAACGGRIIGAMFKCPPPRAMPVYAAKWAAVAAAAVDPQPSNPFLAACRARADLPISGSIRRSDRYRAGIEQERRLCGGVSGGQGLRSPPVGAV